MELMRAQLETEKKRALFYERATLSIENRTSTLVIISCISV